MTKQRKRSHHEEQPKQVDDLTVAASFAQIPVYLPQASVEEGKAEVNDHRSNVQSARNDESESDSDADSEDNDQDDDAMDNLAEDKNDESDDESEIDLSEALAKMHDESDGPKQQTQNKAPTTEHEVDPYKTPIDELQSNFQLNLTVAEEEHLRLAGSIDTSNGNKKNAGPVQLCPAGHVTCHMVDDRTIVVESTPTQKKGPLDEGSLLVVSVKTESDEGEKMRLLPLGKVFEVFGPISRPLYTIRLPPPPSHPKKKEPQGTINVLKKKNSEQKIALTDDNEISISDDDEDEDPVMETAPVTEKEPDDKPLPPDDWSPIGQFTAILAASPRQTVFYIEDEAKLLDTFAIMRTSGKGCDASNLYDEEVLNSNDLYFSDDEQEREHKNRGKKKGGKNQRRDRANDNHGPQPNIPGFHAPLQQQAPQHVPGFHQSALPPPPPPPRQPYPQMMGQQAAPYNPYPQGNMPPQQNMPYHQHPPQHGYPPHQPYPTGGQQQYPYPPQGGQLYATAPYPYPQQFQQQPYQQQQYQQQPYPPNANPPNAPDESDTVYFS